MRSEVCHRSPYSNHYHIFGFEIISSKHSNCFFNGEPNKNIYINQLTCFMATKQKGKVNNYKGPFITYNNHLNDGILH